MELSFTRSITFGFIAVLLILLLRYCLIVRKIFSGFPIFHLLPDLLYCRLAKKIAKDDPLTSIIFRKLVDVGKQHTKEGLFMTYTTRPCLFIFSEEAVKFFLNHKAAMDKSPDYRIIQEAMGKGIHTSNGEKWRKHRKMINPTFHIGMLKEKVPQFNQHALALVKDLKTSAGKPSTKLLDALKCHYFNALSESILGLKQNEEYGEENVKFFQLVDTGSHMIVNMMLSPWLRWKLFKNILPFGRTVSRMTKNYKSYVENVISDMKKFAISNKTIDAERFDAQNLNKSFTYIMLDHHLKDPTFTFEDVYGEVGAMLVGGYDTVTYTTFWSLFLLGLHPEVQEMAFNEIQLITGSSVTYEESCNLTYLESIIMETLRLYPTIPIFGRNLSEDVEFGKYKVPRNTTIAFFPYLLHRNSEIYPNPEKFYPNRFFNQETKRKWNFMPFSDGIRNCIGKKYAIIEMKIFLAHILRNFKITSCDRPEDVSLCWNIVISPAKHPSMILQARQGK